MTPVPCRHQRKQWQSLERAPQRKLGGKSPANQGNGAWGRRMDQASSLPLLWGIGYEQGVSSRFQK